MRLNELCTILDTLIAVDPNRLVYAAGDEGQGESPVYDVSIQPAGMSEAPIWILARDDLAGTTQLTLRTLRDRLRQVYIGARVSATAGVKIADDDAGLFELDSVNQRKDGKIYLFVGDLDEG